MAPRKGIPKTPGSGRKKNTPNKSTANAREAIAAFVNKQSERLESLLERIEEEQGPKAAWQCIMDLVEYHVPKLARTEVTGANGGAVQAETTIKIVPVTPANG